MKKITLLFLVQTVFSFAQDFKTPYEKGNGNQTTTYEEMVKFYDDLDKNFESISVVEKGKDDNGEPIRVVIFDKISVQIKISRIPSETVFFRSVLVGS